MKRFEWPLQRLLNVTIQRERAQRMELFSLSQQIAAIHQTIFRRKAVLGGALTRLGEKPDRQRMPEQQQFMLLSPVEQMRHDRLQKSLSDLQEKRSQKAAAFKKTKSSREALERLRDEALQNHTKEILKIEQKQLDETSQIAFARGLIAQRAGKAE